jgi:ATP-dependent DNA helicase RecG
MKPQELQRKIEELLGLPHEIEWVEFKHNVFDPNRIGRDISALSNSACLHYQPYGYLLWGVEDRTRRVVGTSVKPKSEKVGNEGFENWLTTQLSPKVNFQFYDLSFSSQRLVLLMVDAAKGSPVLFSGAGYVRVGSCTRNLKELPDKERQIWQSSKDWSVEICPDASINDLHPEALQKARLLYSQKNPGKQAEIAAWDDLTFLNKAKLAIQGKITRTAILLLGVPESSGYLSPSQAQITWVVYDEKNNSRDYEHFGLPFLLQADRVLAKIRNLNYRYLPEGTLFPTEITKYDPYVIREALHNCIAHQDYTLCGRISVAEKPDELIFTNPGSFIPGSVEAVITQNSPPAYYRNPFLAAAMVQLKMIDTIGSGIRRMFQIQRDRFFPLPDYEFTWQDTSPPSVTVRIQGKILDENYTRLLIRKPDLKLEDVMLLDKIQKNQKITREHCSHLRKLKLVEGRFPNLFISSVVALEVDKKAQYIRNRGLDDQHYIQMILSFLDKYHKATRKDFNDLLMKNLPDILSNEQKENKVRNLLFRMSKKDKLIENVGTNRKPIWTKMPQ